MEIENKFCAFIDILGFKNKTKNFENAVKYYKDYIRCYDLFTSIDKNIFADINGENRRNYFFGFNYFIFSRLVKVDTTSG